MFQHTRVNKLKFANKYAIIFGNSQQYSHCYIDWSYSRHQMSDSPLTSGGKFYTGDTWKKFLTFILEFMLL